MITINFKNSKYYLLGGLLILTLTLMGCSPDGDNEVVRTDRVSISGEVIGLTGLDLARVTLEAVYTSPGVDPENPTDQTTDRDNTFLLQVEKDRTLYVRATRSVGSFVPIRSAKAPLSFDVDDLEVVIPSSDEANTMINTAFGESIPISEYAWLAVNVVNFNDDEEDGYTIISSTLAPEGEVYIDCDGTGSTGPTIACDRIGPMYLAYFLIDEIDANVTVSGDPAAANPDQMAPLKQGEITVLNFEIPSNLAAVANDDPINVVLGETTTLNLVANDTDGGDGDGLNYDTLLVDLTGTDGLVTEPVIADGTVDYNDGGNTSFSDSFSYTIEDNSGDESDSATVTLTILSDLDSIGGKAIYDDQCAGCHRLGSYDTNSEDPRAPDLTAVVDQIDRQLSGHRFELTSDEVGQLKAFASDPMVQ